MRSLSYATETAVEVTDRFGEVSLVEPNDGQILIELGENAVYLDGQLGTASVIQ